VIAHAQVDGVPGDFVDTVIVNVTSSAAGIPFGVSGLSPSEFPANAIWTGGLRSIEPVNQILSELNIAQNHSPRIRMWFYFTGGDEQRFKDGTGAFNLQAWKDTLDYYATAAHTKPFNTDGSSQFAAQLQPYMQGGALMGILLLDDIGNFTPAVSHAQIEGMAAQAKLRYPGITTAVRQRPSKLGTGTYSSLDAAWAQYEARTSQNDGHTAAQYRDDQIAKARALPLGLVLGINISNGGLQPAGDIPVDSLRSWGDSLLASGTSDYGCAFLMFDKTYGQLSDPAVTHVASLAQNHIASSCLFH